MIFLTLLKTFWKPILIIISLIAVFGSVYYSGYKAGGNACQEAWAEKEKERVEAINERVEEIKTTSIDIAKKQELNNEKRAKDLNKIIADLKNRSGVVNNTYTTVANCKPSDAYVETWNEISKKSNSK
jgi:hypothetical protein